MSVGSRSGHPRGVAFERRIISAAVDTYADTGWSGFSIVAVAKRARAGKASIYARWSNREQLLIEALTSRLGSVDDIDTGAVHGDLVTLTESVLRGYLGAKGCAALRMGLDAHHAPGLARLYEAYRQAQLDAGHLVIERAIKRGELPTARSATTLLDSIFGAALFRAMVEMPDRQSLTDKEIREFAESTVTFGLNATTR
jgi:AcrR family transcriptional regulator